MKIVVGILKESKDKVQEYVNQGYHIEYLNAHVKKIGESLLKDDLAEEDVQRVRNMGYKISSSYWVNLALSSAKSKNRIVVADLQEEDNKASFSRIV